MNGRSGPEQGGRPTKLQTRDGSGAQSARMIAVFLCSSIPRHAWSLASQKGKAGNKQAAGQMWLLLALHNVLADQQKTKLCCSCSRRMRQKKVGRSRPKAVTKFAREACALTCLSTAEAPQALPPKRELQQVAEGGPPHRPATALRYGVHSVGPSLANTAGAARDAGAAGCVAAQPGITTASIGIPLAACDTEAAVLQPAATEVGSGRAAGRQCAESVPLFWLRSICL